MLLMAMGLVLKAQTPEVVSRQRALVKLDQPSRYLLIPIEEQGMNATINVLGADNRVMQSFSARLAVSKVDYYVPLEIKEGKLLDFSVRFPQNDERSIGDLACWKNLKYSDTFDATNRERFRPLYHHTPAYGWMNDPNGMYYKDGVYHLSYQWNPYGSMWGNMTWGHSTSRDLIHWEQQPATIWADGLGSIFSGSAVVDKDNTAGFGAGAVVAFYTSAGAAQMQSMAYSTDGGRTFTKYERNPVLTLATPDFRDPKVFWNEDIHRWNMILAAGQQMRIYSSANLKEWTYESSFGEGYGAHGGVWECPDLMKLPVRGSNQQKWMLVCNINPGGPFGGSATQYFIGQFDGHKFTCETAPEVTKWMDYGKDHYATVTFSNAPDGRHIALAWMSNWQYANQVPTMQFRSANSVPRDLDLFEYQGQTYLGVTPSKELLAARGEKVKQPTESCEIVVDLKKNTQLVLSNAKGEQVTMSYDAKQQTFSMNREKSGEVSFSEAFPCVTVAPTHGNLKQLRIFIDRCSIEVLDAEGHMAMTNLVFPSEPYNKLVVENGKATIYEISGGAEEHPWELVLKEETSSASTKQGAACFDKYLFQFHNSNDVISIFNLDTKAKVQEIPLTAVSTHHCNNANFGKEYYSAGDPFPLLYTSQENEKEHKCLVYRVTGTEGNYSVSLVQTIHFPEPSDDFMWYPNMMIDTQNSKMIVAGLGNNPWSKGRDNIIRYKVFDLPKLSEGPEVTLSLNSIEDSIELTNKPTTQGGFVYDNKIYEVFGLGDNATLIATDLTTHKEVFAIDINGTGIAVEPEGCFRYDNSICVNFVDGQVYKYKFS